MKNSTKKIPSDILSFKHKLGLLFVAMSSLMLEFTLIRVLSISLWYHFAFMIISIALLGFGISGVAIVISDRINKSDINRFLTIISLIYSVSILVCFGLINKIPFDPFSILAKPIQFLYLPLYYLIIVLPFFFAGLIIGRIFSRFKSDISKLYFFDLFGAGLSCFVFIIIVPLFGGSGGIITASLIAATATLIFSTIKSKLSTIGLIGGLILIIANSYFLTEPDNTFPISISPNKFYGNYMQENPGLRILTKWNSFSRVDVLQDEDPPIDAYPVYTAVIDAGNSTTNIPQVPAITDSLPPPMDASNLAMILKNDSANVFIVGSGGGGEIVSALSYHAKTITAVEINGILNDLIKKDFAASWTSGIAKNKKVNIITDDARGYLRGKRLKFDVIISAHTISASAVASGAMSLVENYIMTKEAIEDYLFHLKPDGILYISRPESQIPRLVTTLKIATLELGGLNPRKNFFVFKRPPSEFEKDMSFLAGVVYKKDGLNQYDIELLKTQAALLNLDIIYDPTSKQEGIYKDLIESDNIFETVKKYPINLLPATDDNPYFEHQTKFSDLNLSDIRESFSQTDRAIISLVQKPAAESTLIIIFIQSVIIAGVLIFLPVCLKFKKRAEYRDFKKGKYLLYFSFLGLGYIMIEICLIQKFNLFLGQPVYTLLTVISTLLIFSGIGSMVSDKIVKLFKNSIIPLFIIIAFLSILIGLLNPKIFIFFARTDELWRVIISVIIIAPLAFFMGIPFPYGFARIPAIKDDNRFLTAYSWGVNGFFSVIGSVVVVMLSMTLGFRLVFIISAIIYLLALLTVSRFKSPIKS